MVFHVGGVSKINKTMKKIFIVPLLLLLSCSKEQRVSNGINFLQSDGASVKKCELISKLYNTDIIYCDHLDDCITVKDKDDKVFVLHIDSDLVDAIGHSYPSIEKLPKLDCSQVSSVD